MLYYPGDMEATNEELQRCNEELESKQWEMQSLNEELETSREELQSKPTKNSSIVKSGNLLISRNN